MAADSGVRPAESAGVPVLLLLLLCLAAGPVLAPHLPSGPASLMQPGPACVGIAVLLLVWLLFVWPSLTRCRETGNVLGTGLLVLLAGVPFLLGVARLGGLHGREILAAFLVLGVAAGVTALYLTGPGRRIERDRWWGAGVALVLVAIPFGNYALNEFAGMTGDAGYRVSPILLLRRILLGRAGADATPFLLLAGVLAVSLVVHRWRAGSAGVLLLLVAAGSVRAEGVTVEPVLGEYYVPRRAIPFRVTAPADADEVWFRIPGAGKYGGPASSRRSRFLPLGRTAGGVQVRLGSEGAWQGIDLPVRPVPEGRFWVVSLTAIPPGLASNPRIAVARAPRSPDRSEIREWLCVDGVYATAGVLDEERARLFREAGIPVFRDVPEDVVDILGRARGPGRRLWEEGDDTTGLLPLFTGRGRGHDRGDAELVLAFLGALTGLGLVYLRYSGSRRWSIWARARDIGFLSLLGILAQLASLPTPPDVRRSFFHVGYGSRVTYLQRLDGDRDGVWSGTCDGVPLAPGPGEEPEVLCVAESGAEEFDHRIRVRVREGESRIVVHTWEGASLEDFEPDLVIGPGGLSLPGEEPAAPVDFLRGHLRDEQGHPTTDGIAVRRLLDLAELPSHRYAVRLPGPGGWRMSIRPLD